MAKPETRLIIEALGRQGDGLATGADGAIYVAGALPGEEVTVRAIGPSRAELSEIITPSPARVVPPCPAYGECGGCMAQHMAADIYEGWKTDILANAMRHRGLGDVPLDPLARVAPAAMRRARLAYRRKKNALSLGYRARGSKNTVDVAHCLLLTPKLATLFGPIRELLTSLTGLGAQGEVALTETDTGVDLRLQGAASPGLAEREKLADFAARHDLARISYVTDAERTAETIAMNRAPAMRFGGVAVALPDGAFVQPSAEGEALIRRHVLAGTKDAPRVADLYAGCGAFSLPVAATGARVLAVEGDEAMAASLRSAAGSTGSHLEVESRDLTRRPLDAGELKRFDAVILDPPRAGALAQMHQIARSDVGTVVSVSCNPATFARDARVLIDGGYHINAVSPIDQFPYSSHLEVVGIFRR